jgi:apolipoprotein N-acyltransferase
MASAASVNMSSLRTQRIALAVYALATLLAFPHEIPGIGSVDLGLGFVWLIPAALVIGIEGRTARDAARAVFVASLVGHVFLFHWFYVVTVSYGGMPWWLGVFAPLAPALFVSTFSAFFAYGWVSLRGRGSSSILSGAALWVVADWARAHFLGGFPWAALGYALHLDIPLLTLTRFAGVYGLAFVAVAVGIALARALTSANRTSFRDLALAVVALIVLHGPGMLAATPNAELQRRVRIAAVQGNIDQGQKWDAARRNQILEKYLGLSEQAVEDGAQWVVWPETALPGLVELEPALAERLVEFSSQRGVALVVGGMGVAPDESGRRIGAFFDSAFVFDSDGALVDRYDKTQPVPFGDFVPLRGLLGRFFKALATGLSSSDVTAGDAPRVVNWGDPAGDGSVLRVAVPICYELLFPHLVRGFGADGADVMLAITNDAWYGRTGAPHQFLAMTAMRAAENGRWIVRAANTGVSAIIDDRGQVRERSELFEDALIVADVPVAESQEQTFYARFGDVFAGVCALAVLWALGRDFIGARGAI